MKKIKLRLIIILGVILSLGITFIAYASISWDSDDSSTWYGPADLFGHTDPTATATFDDSFDDYSCPKDIPPAPGVGGGTWSVGGGGGGGGGGA